MRGGVQPEPQVLVTHNKAVLSRFVKLVILEGTHLVKPSDGRQSIEGWVRNKNILGSYLLSSATQYKIGNIYGLSQPNVSMVIQRSIRYLWQNSSVDLQKQFILSKQPTETKHKQTESRTLHPRETKQPILPEPRPIHPALKEALARVNFTFIDPHSRESLKQVFKEGAHLITPPGMSPDRWLTYKNIFGTYILSHASLDQVGQLYGISGERVRQINEEVLETLFPNQTVSLDKSVKHTPKEWLLVGDNLGSELVELLENGLSADQIKMRLKSGHPRNKVIKALKLLRELEFNVGKIKDARGENSRLGQQLSRENLSDEEVKELFNQITIRAYTQFVDQGLILTIRDLLHSSGFHYKIDWHAQLFYEALKEAGIPIGKIEQIVHKGKQKGIRYYQFITSQHKLRAEEALKNNPNLVKFLENLVTQISGPEANIPTTTQLQRSAEFLSLKSILSDFGISANSRSRKSKELVEAVRVSNEVPLFEYAGTPYIWVDDIPKVRSFILSRLQSNT